MGHNNNYEALRSVLESAPYSASLVLLGSNGQTADGDHILKPPNILPEHLMLFKWCTVAECPEELESTHVPNHQPLAANCLLEPTFEQLLYSQ